FRPRYPSENQRSEQAPADPAPVSSRPPDLNPRTAAFQPARCMAQAGMADSIQYQLEDGVAVITLDDGKANAIGHDLIASLNEALSRAEAEASSVLLVGRPGRFSAGYNLSEMMAGADSARRLVRSGGELLLRVFSSPLPVVAACSGHALAAGAILLLAC